MLIDGVRLATAPIPSAIALGCPTPKRRFAYSRRVPLLECCCGLRSPAYLGAGSTSNVNVMTKDQHRIVRHHCSNVVDARRQDLVAEQAEEFLTSTALGSRRQSNERMLEARPLMARHHRRGVRNHGDTSSSIGNTSSTRWVVTSAMRRPVHEGPI
jgi:hypothetical protein